MGDNKNIHLKVYYPTAENEAEYHKRASLYFISYIKKKLDSEEINKFIEELKKAMDSSK
ncbi:hypothetical protein BJV85_002132 [Clostridium acetobutylicum]|uniref:Uncharacterized protein n=1 Tax=Clostridium acetobutylicum (strain ATCC 824 / DSM 792 / JCM 1419 / IAM 19013 / LMG 5710 / NBRC 13948 / NRRL B-527 / VKM B-1787 / 2291 / W) TaxID=272562 RepID=Q97HZ2_CLOAB|nr:MULTISPECIES: hypothetical protein [Clostridium]AAK79828.1 Hypothetical protein CA_C1864 [Clostridium acetobutylicum ATCC 824]AEI32008.1 hypothetical protein SMB_G1889 [Clostridium acetobutylicum DSM 1731]AWV79741.1 hypothetical protein DK921_06440 [Clostridium acetobutylicum]MBC2394280.1 hypothetical protein [Clostridium acetobutylicum]MBC2584664.1 hypothetical protein [Clostridium acetobutylicum]